MLQLHRRCESIEASLRAEISDLRQALVDQREVAFARERELVDRLLAATDPSAAARIASVVRSERPASSLPGLAVGVRRIPTASPFVRNEPAKPRSPLLQPSAKPQPDTDAAAAVAAVTATK